MIPILDWIFEGIVNWVASIAAQLMDAVSGLFLDALGTDMAIMEAYFPFVTKAYSIFQYTAWAILFLIFAWQLFRSFGGPITEAENPWHLLIRGAIFAVLIGYARPIFDLCLDIAKAPYTSLMEVSMTSEDFTFAGIEQVLTNGLTTLVSSASVVGLILILILLIALGWNYFKLLLETVERYIVVGVLCYTSPLAFSVGGSKATNNVFKSWCRMVGSQLLLLVMNVWFLRGFASSVGQFIGNGGATPNGQGSIFLWMFCALAYLKCAQRFDSYLASMGLNVAQTGSSMAMEMMMAARVISGLGGGARSAGAVFGRNGGNATATGTGVAGSNFAAGFASRFNPNSYVRDAVVEGGERMGFSGGAGVFGRAVGGMAARNGASLSGESISSVAGRAPGTSGTIGGDIADRSLGNYMPHMAGMQMKGTQISGGHISTTATTSSGKTAEVDMYSASQFEKPEVPHSVVTASDGSQWYQMASGEGRGAFYDAPVFGGMSADSAVAEGMRVEGTGLGEDPAMPTGAMENPVSTILDGTEAPQVGAGIGGIQESENTAVDSISGMPPLVGGPGAEPNEMLGAGEFPTSMAPLEMGLGESVSDRADLQDISEMPQIVGGESAVPGASGVEIGAEAPSFAASAMEQSDFETPVSGYESGVPFAGTSMEMPVSNGTHNGETSEAPIPDAYSEAPLVAATFPGAQEGTSLRTVGEGVIEASSPDGGNTLWYNSAFYQEPDAPHGTMEAANGVPWFTMQQKADAPSFEEGDAAAAYNQAAFQNFMPGFDTQVSQVDGTHRQDGHFEVRHADGSGTAFYDTARYAPPRGDYQVFEDAKGSQWYAIRGEAAVERKPVFENGQAVYEGEKLKTVTVDTVRYKQTPAKYSEPKKRGDIVRKPPRRKI